MLQVVQQKSQEYIERKAQYAGLYMYYSRILNGSELRHAVATEFRMKLATSHKKILWN